MVFQKYRDIVEETDTIKYMGRVLRVRGLVIESEGPQVHIGELCRIVTQDEQVHWAEVIGLDQTTVRLMPYAETAGLKVGDTVVAMGERLSVPVGEQLLGRVLNGMGKPIDGKGDVYSPLQVPTSGTPPNVLDRAPISESLYTGIRAIDAMTPVGQGQRMGIFAGSGVGKSTLMGMIARNTEADINVIALIGERGREVREFIENDLGPDGLARSVLIVSTSDTPPLARLKGAYVAQAIAEYFRDQGKNVMLLFDSVTRFARALREIGLSAGEPPATRGYPPSVFSTLPKLLERCGPAATGSITGFYSVLVDGDDMDEPIADTVRGILDGHIVLSRRLAEKSHYPAIDTLGSVSRLATRLLHGQKRSRVAEIKRLLATYREQEDLISVGAYVKGSLAEVDRAIETMPRLNAFLTQDIDERTSPEDLWRAVGLVLGHMDPDDHESEDGSGEGDS